MSHWRISSTSIVLFIFHSFFFFAFYFPLKKSRKEEAKRTKVSHLFISNAIFFFGIYLFIYFSFLLATYARFFFVQQPFKSCNCRKTKFPPISFLKRNQILSFMKHFIHSVLLLCDYLEREENITRRVVSQ